MPKLTPYPIPRMRYHGGRWRIYWKFNKKQYTISTNHFDEKKTALVTSDLRRISAALAENEPAFPEKYRQSPAVQEYIEARYGPEAGESPIGSEEVLDEYEAHMSRHCGRSWSRTSTARVRDLHAVVEDGILATTPRQANQFLESVLARGRKAATRNRTRTALSRFFNWCKTNGYVTSNPLAEIKQLKEADAEEITYCSKTERKRVLEAATRLDLNDCIAIPIALFAGCRREEVFNLRWEDINLKTRRLTVRKSKTGKKRLTPISKELLEVFLEHKKERGPVVPPIAGETWENQADRIVEAVREFLSRPENPNLAGKPSEAVGKRRFLMTEQDLMAQKNRIISAENAFAKSSKKGKALLTQAVKLAGLLCCPDRARDGGEWIPAERIGWNAWRHTFATLRAQAGVSLDKISSWMGNTPEVCKKHYAQFMPRDEVDDDIDK